MKRLSRATLVLLLLLTVAASMVVSQAPIDPNGIPLWLEPTQKITFGGFKGQTLPNGTFEDMQGDPHELYEFQGGILVLHFWASWCGPCVEEMPSIMEAAKTHPEVTFVLINMYEGIRDINNFLMQYAPLPENVHALRERDGRFGYPAWKDLDINGYPTTIIVDGNLVVLRRYIGQVTEGWLEYLK